MLISHKHKKVILNLRNPGLLLATIPTAKVFDYKGHKLVAVPHNVDETRVLRNMGYKIPSPVETQYEWSGQYIPFKAQLKRLRFSQSTHVASYSTIWVVSMPIPSI